MIKNLFYSFFSLPLCSVIPSRPEAIQAVEVTNSSLHIRWQSGFGGLYPIMQCAVQVRRADRFRDTALEKSNTGQGSIKMCT